MRSRKTKGTQFCLHLFIVCFVVVGGASIVASEDRPGRLIPFLFFFLLSCFFPFTKWDLGSELRVTKDYKPYYTHTPFFKIFKDHQAWWLTLTFQHSKG